MSLNQIIQHQTGLYSSYWRIISCNLNYLNKTSEIVIYGYYNQTSRDEDKLNLDYRVINCSNLDFEQYF